MNLFKDGFRSSVLPLLQVAVGLGLRKEEITLYASLVPRPSTPPVFDRFQYAKTEGEGLGNFIT